MEDILFELYYKQVHRNEELEQTIEELQNDLKQSNNKIKRLNNQIDRHITAVNDLTDIVETSHKVIDELKKENNSLRRNIEYLCEENARLRHDLNEVKNNANNKIY